VFGAIEGFIRGLEQIFAILAMFGKDRHAEGDGNVAYKSAFVGDGMMFDFKTQFFHALKGIVQGSLWQDEDKFFATIPAGDITPADVGFEQGG
jgi:hypothetical protein